ncbi:hypothetical protein B0I37DRAFT_222499 [Chaetomium sp. MPI-CAGE-AT-0009]|nr:hypothetical protein B0I37DRAFT_222499 [Chaetomium sp. MPI-CAGE-AT-0009]
MYWWFAPHRQPLCVLSGLSDAVHTGIAGIWLSMAVADVCFCSSASLPALDPVDELLCCRSGILSFRALRSTLSV